MQIAALCLALKLDYQSLMAQPAWWVDAMSVMLQARNRWEQLQQKPSKRKA